MRTSFFRFLCISFLSFVCVSSVFAYSFSRDLSVGSVGEDVRELQKVLNADTRTRVAVAGDGASGFETTYYGALTADAVRRYQELYRAEILTPLGLFMGTGFFGAGTRGFMMAKSAVHGLTTVISNDPEGVDENLDDFQKAQESKYASAEPIKDIIPSTRTELVEQLKDFAGGGQITEDVIEEFSRTMMFASQGMEYQPAQREQNPQEQDPDGDNPNGPGTGACADDDYECKTRKQQSSGGSSGDGGGGCIDILFDLLFSGDIF